MKKSSPPSLSFTLREWGRMMQGRKTLFSLACVSGVATLTGPFNTSALLAPVPRLIYWSALVFYAYGAGLLANILARTFLPNASRIAQIATSSILCTMAVLLGVVALNTLVLGWLPSPLEWPEFVFVVATITLIINIALAILLPDTPTTVEILGEEQRIPRLLDRIPFEKRGQILALSVEDHYVRVRTSEGEELLLMRLSDAIREVDGLPGAQVHRSHWVNFEAVTQVERISDRARLTLSDGAHIPVSRANLAKIRAAGLLPKRSPARETDPAPAISSGETD